MNLTDSDVGLLGAHASGSAAALNEHLNSAFGHPRSFTENSEYAGVCVHRSAECGDALGSQNVSRLMMVVECGQIMDRVVACLRILDLPDSALADSPQQGAQEIATAQRVLSQTLVAHPVLMHNRILVPATHELSNDFDPIARIIATSLRAQFPRLVHGVDAGSLRAFARHHCVTTGLNEPAPPCKATSHLSEEGLAAWLSPLSHPAPRQDFLMSIWELDELRSFSAKSFRKRKPLLPLSPRTEGGFQAAVSRAVLEPFLRQPQQGTGNFDQAEFISMMQRTGISTQPGFL